MPVLPHPRHVLALRHDQLAEAGLAEFKAHHALELARAFDRGDVDADTLARLPASRALQAIVDLRGVAGWAAACTAIFGLGERDVLPAEDLALRRAVRRLYSLPVLPEPAELERIAERWAGWRSYAAVYLWHERGEAPLG